MGLGLGVVGSGLSSKCRVLEEERRLEEEGQEPRSRGKGGGCRTGPQGPYLVVGAARQTSQPNCLEGTFLQSAQPFTAHAGISVHRAADTRSLEIRQSPGVQRGRVCRTWGAGRTNNC